jgi:hypothetical protein
MRRVAREMGWRGARSPASVEPACRRLHRILRCLDRNHRTRSRSMERHVRAPSLVVRMGALLRRLINRGITGGRWPSAGRQANGGRSGRAADLSRAAVAAHFTDPRLDHFTLALRLRSRGADQGRHARGYSVSRSSHRRCGSSVWPVVLSHRRRASFSPSKVGAGGEIALLRRVGQVFIHSGTMLEERGHQSQYGVPAERCGLRHVFGQR